MVRWSKMWYRVAEVLRVHGCLSVLEMVAVADDYRAVDDFQPVTATRQSSTAMAVATTGRYPGPPVLSATRHGVPGQKTIPRGALVLIRYLELPVEK